MYEVLLDHLGEPDKWHETAPFEIVVGAVLVQNTTWTNVERSIASLREADVLSPSAVLDLPEDALQALIRPSGFQTAKARTLRGMAAWVLENAPHLDGESAVNGSAACSPGLREAIAHDDAELRASLLTVPGIGPETADVIALYVFGRKAFIWDTYGRRMLTALGWQVGSGYEQTRRLLEAQVRPEELTVQEMRDFHSLVLLAGKAARRAGGWQQYATALPWD